MDRDGRRTEEEKEKEIEVEREKREKSDKRHVRVLGG